MKMNIDNLLFEKVVIIKYRNSNCSGIMIVLEKFYEKNIKKFQRKMKDVEVYYMCSCDLTPELVQELGI